MSPKLPPPDRPKLERRFLVSLTAEDYERLEELARRRRERPAVTARTAVLAALDEEMGRRKK